MAVSKTTNVTQPNSASLQPAKHTAACKDNKVIIDLSKYGGGDKKFELVVNSAGDVDVAYRKLFAEITSTDPKKQTINGGKDYSKGRDITGGESWYGIGPLINSIREQCGNKAVLDRNEQIGEALNTATLATDKDISKTNPWVPDKNHPGSSTRQHSEGFGDVDISYKRMQENPLLRGLLPQGK